MPDYKKRTVSVDLKLKRDYFLRQSRRRLLLDFSEREKRVARPFELEVGISALGPSILEKEWIELPDLSLPAQGCSLFATKQTKETVSFFYCLQDYLLEVLFSFEGKVEQWISTLIWVTSEIQLLQLLPPSKALRSLIHWFYYCLLFFMSKLIGLNTKVHVSLFTSFHFLWLRPWTVI